ncbi:MAG: glycosyl hydrolase family 28 protein [Terracidiphilus sp.]
MPSRRAPAADSRFRASLSPPTSNNFTLYRITLKNSPNFHVVFNHADGLTVWGLKIDTPQRLARNTDGVDPGNGAKNITITHSYIRTGDDNVAIKGGLAGGGGPGGATNITISHDHFYWGHGMSIGSETNGGVSKIRVFDLSLDGPTTASASNRTARVAASLRMWFTTTSAFATRPIPSLWTRPTPPTAPAGRFASNYAGYYAPQCPRLRRRQYHPQRVRPRSPHRGYARRCANYRSGRLHLRAQSRRPHARPQSDQPQLPAGPDLTNQDLTNRDSTISGKPAEGDPASCADKFVPFPE